MISAEQLNNSLRNEDWPHFDDVSIGDQNVKCNFTVRDDLSYLEGHFPQQPIVPGVVQVHWAGELSKQFFVCEGFSSLKKVKFSNPILPNISLQLSLSYKEGTKQINFIYSDDLQTFSSGVISFK